MTFKLSAAEQARIKRETIEWMAWEKQQMFYPQRPPCGHAARTADLKRTHWSAFSGLICSKASVVSRNYGGGTEQRYFCQDHAPEPSIDLTPQDRQAILDAHANRANPAIAWIQDLRRCHLYYSPELADAGVETQTAYQGDAADVPCDASEATAAEAVAVEITRHHSRPPAQTIVEQHELFA